jgi:hypothetical protein
MLLLVLVLSPSALLDMDINLWSLLVMLKEL